MILRDFVLWMLRYPLRLHVVIGSRQDGQGYILVLTVNHNHQNAYPVHLVGQTFEQIVAYAHGVFDGALGVLENDAQYTKQVEELRVIIRQILNNFTAPGVIHTYHYPNLILSSEPVPA